MDKLRDREEDIVMKALDELLQAEHRALIDEAAVPSSAIVWWRAQAQARREALEQATRPISVVQGIAVACAGGLTATAAGVYLPTFRRALDWVLVRTGSWSGVSLPAEPLADPLILALVLATAVCAVFTPLALYFTLRED
jgi:hypothetical protein